MIDVEFYEAIRTIDSEYFVSPLFLDPNNGWECWSHKGKTYSCMAELAQHFDLSPQDRAAIESGLRVTITPRNREDEAAEERYRLRHPAPWEEAEISELETQSLGVEFPDPM